MTRFAAVRGIAFTSLAVLLVVIGAAMRPVFAPVTPPLSPPVLNATEIGFIQDMAAHHQQAIQIVQRLDPGAEPDIEALAQQIRDTQTAEIGMFLGWLRLAEAPPVNRQPMSWMTSDSAALHQHLTHSPGPDTSPGLMPGMATRTELDSLASARGHDAEGMFLQLMHRHHLGGVEMAQAADQLIADGPVKQAARDIMAAQSQEAGLIAVLLTQTR
ncbi:DUF305 domain-containing protein [Rhodococcus qingshengii]|uniref:DUF305 domain-containing protein n=1 Tax=Rhodococcus qingshengii TaxID=334542 RepID=UPI001F1B269E|nr:DUF305 domain-containing protein [Rhodococcus qingshengii]